MKPTLACARAYFLLLAFTLVSVQGNAIQIFAQQASAVDYSYTGAIAWSSNNQLAISSSRGLWVYDVNAGSVSLIGDCNDLSNAPSFSLDNHLLAYITGRERPYDLRMYNLSLQVEQFSYSVDDDFIYSPRFSADRSRLAYVSGESTQIDPIYNVSLLNIEQGTLTRTLNFDIPSAFQLEWQDTSSRLWMLGGEVRDVIIFYTNAVNANSGELVFRLPSFGEFIEVRDDGTFFSFGAAQLVNNFAVFYVPIEPYLSPGFVIYDLRGDLEGLNRMGPGPSASFDDIDRGLVIPYPQLSDLFTLNRQIRTLALVERETPDQFRLLNIDSQETTGSVEADARITELQFSPDGTLLAVRTTSERRDEVHIELWDIASLERTTVLEVSQWQASECGETTEATPETGD